LKIIWDDYIQPRIVANADLVMVLAFPLDIWPAVIFGQNFGQKLLKWPEIK